MKSVIDAFGLKPIAYNPLFRYLTGTPTAAIILSQLHYWWSITGRDDIWKTDDELAAECALTPKEVRNAKAKLKKLPFMRIEPRGVPPRTHYIIDKIAFAEALAACYEAHKDKLVTPGESNQPNEANQSAQMGEIKSAQMDKSNPPKWTNPYTRDYNQETTSETTQETTSLSLAPEPKSASGAARRGGGKREPITNAVWQAYRDAYVQRYGVEPIRNARVNGMLAQFVRRLGADIAPQVAAYYLRCNHRWYVARGHSVDAMLRDAEKLYTEWASGRVITDTEARNIDRMQGNYNAFARLLAECEEEIRKQGGDNGNGSS